ncbi:phosphotransferase family protein [Bacillus sp. FJAT-28004]|uniref:phosphotransferase family protein n=1 Tax=Bacillus sp. FJAT-28004 TaxID=1679165 RepID=UPI0006B495DF|nr:aminoglycoside phosphotransferase family protein [Bacillus sp. FJAT-28004]
MKEGWERTEQHISLDLKQLNELIKPALSGIRVITAERLSTGFSNSNYKIILEGSSTPYVVRLFRGDGEIAQKEAAIAKLVRESVPVADYIYLDTSCSTFDKAWAVLEWKEGFLLRDVLKAGTSEDVAAAASSVGSVLARIHSFTFPKSGFLDKDLTVTQPFQMDDGPFISFIEQCLYNSPCGKWLGEELTEQVWSFCQTHRSILPENMEPPVLVHSDFNGLNILMRNEREGCSVSAVLDWEFAFSWRRHADIANMLRYEEDGSLFENHFIRSYQENGGVLNGKWKLLSRLEDLVALCDMLSHSTVDSPNRVRDLKRLIARTVQRY